MTYEEKKKLIEAAKMLKEHCKETCAIDGKCDCIFSRVCGGCKIFGPPKTHEIPPIHHWTQEDIITARALKTLGANVISKDEEGNLVWFRKGDDEFYEGYGLPSYFFPQILNNEVINLKYIINEAEKSNVEGDNGETKS